MEYEVHLEGKLVRTGNRRCNKELRLSLRGSSQSQEDRAKRQPVRSVYWHHHLHALTWKTVKDRLTTGPLAEIYVGCYDSTKLKVTFM